MRLGDGVLSKSLQHLLCLKGLMILVIAFPIGPKLPSGLAGPSRPLNHYNCSSVIRNPLVELPLKKVWLAVLEPPFNPPETLVEGAEEFE